MHGEPLPTHDGPRDASDQAEATAVTGATAGGGATDPPRPRRRWFRLRNVLLAILIVLVVAVALGWYLVNRYFFNNPPAPPEFTLTPQVAPFLFLNSGGASMRRRPNRSRKDH